MGIRLSPRDIVERYSIAVKNTIGDSFLISVRQGGAFSQARKTSSHSSAKGVFIQLVEWLERDLNPHSLAA